MQKTILKLASDGAFLFLFGVGVGMGVGLGFTGAMALMRLSGWML